MTDDLFFDPETYPEIHELDNISTLHYHYIAEYANLYNMTIFFKVVNKTVFLGLSCSSCGRNILVNKGKIHRKQKRDMIKEDLCFQCSNYLYM